MRPSASSPLLILRVTDAQQVVCVAAAAAVAADVAAAAVGDVAAAACAVGSRCTVVAGSEGLQKAVSFSSAGPTASLQKQCLYVACVAFRIEMSSFVQNLTVVVVVAVVGPAPVGCGCVKTGL
jgi:hypothetical protein